MEDSEGVAEKDLILVTINVQAWIKKKKKKKKKKQLVTSLEMRGGSSLTHTDR